MAQNILGSESTLVIGATGLIGQALMREGRRRGDHVVGLARHGADITCDATDRTALFGVLAGLDPRIIVNAAALTDLALCEREPETAHRINALMPAMLADFCDARTTRLIHVSTDHYYSGDGALRHDETAPVKLLNVYAHSKYAGETAALNTTNSLVIRTNITGWRGWANKPTFFEWLIQAIESRAPMTLFDDFYTSTLDAGTCARHILALGASETIGLLNLAANDVATKAVFARTTARALGINLDWAGTGSVASLNPRRAESLGLDVSKAERLLGESLPDTAGSIAALLAARP